MTSAHHIRPIYGCIFANERATTPSATGRSLWDAVVKLHSKHVHREAKSGRMFGGYEINGTRANENVPFRSIIQLDIDTMVGKDKDTGEIVAVVKRAPNLNDIRAAIDEYEWIAASSHSHDPANGIVKYRIVMLPDRDFIEDEHKPILEALDELLGGVIDRGAWAWSQAFFTPSCPPTMAHQAFAVHNEGIAVPVDKLVARGRQIIASKRSSVSVSLGNNTAKISNIPDTPENVARVKAMLDVIDPDVPRKEWLQVCWAVQASGLADAPQIIREWSEKGELFQEKDFQGVLKSFDPARGTGFGTLVHIAKQHGFVGDTRDDDNLFDIKNARLFAKRFQNRLLYIHETGEWLAFSERNGWISASPGAADRAAKHVQDVLRHEAAELYKKEPDSPGTKRAMRHAEYTSRLPNLRAMIELAKSEPEMTKRLADFDANPMLLGVENGVLDLQNGSLASISPNVLVSKRCNVAFDPKATCPRFLRFLREVQPDRDVRLFLRRFVGYCLTGLVREHMFVFFHGGGHNGKSVFVEIENWLLGDYAKKIPTEMLMHHQRSPQGPSPDVLLLKGLRFVYANETEEGRRLAEARVKEMTGGDTLSGRAPYGKEFVTFQPSHKLAIAGNHRPEITDNSFGMWRRVVMVPFEQTIPEAQRDTKLLETLKGEGPGILNWALLGLADYLQNGLNIPPKIATQTAAYRAEQDIVGEWIREACTIGSTLSVAKTSLYWSYKIWCEQNGHKPLAQGRLTRRLNERGYRLANDKRTVQGIGIVNSRPSPP